MQLDSIAKYICSFEQQKDDNILERKIPKSSDS